MGECEICERDDSISFTCNECGGTYCSTHRLPEAHNCSELRVTDFSGPWFDHSNTEPVDRGTDAPDALSDDEIDENRTGTADAEPGSDESESPRCLECGKITLHECEKCGTPYCKEHKSPRVHNCALLDVAEDDGRGDESPPRPVMPGSPSTEERSLLGATFSILFLPITLLYAVGISARRYWKTSLLVVLIAGGGGLAVTGQLQPLVTGPGDFVDSAADAGGDATDAADSALSNDLDTERVERLVHEGINEIRANRSLRTLNHDSELRTIASQYSKRMATEGFYSHTDPQGNDFEDRYAAAGYQCRVPISENRYATGAENIQYTFAFTDVRDDGETESYDSERELANAIVENWMQSSGHRENILKSYWRNEGIGVYAIENPDEVGQKVYVTQNFC